MIGERDDDDAALAWAGDEKLAPEPPTAVVETPASVVETPASRVETPDSRVELVETSPTNTQIPAPLLVTYGILGGLYLIYTIGWVITVTRSTTTLPTLLGEVMFQLGEFLAIASPAIWFAAVVLLTRGRRPIIRLLLLLAGLVATIPWPFLLGV